jgi:hypothetical protein
MPLWRWNKKTVTITFDLNEMASLGAMLNEWAMWKPWMDREDCENWKRSPIARENRRESITYGNCLSSIETYLGREGIRKAMEMAVDRHIATAQSEPETPEP